MKTVIIQKSRFSWLPEEEKPFEIIDAETKEIVISQASKKEAIIWVNERKLKYRVV